LLPKVARGGKQSNLGVCGDDWGCRDGIDEDDDDDDDENEDDGAW
jgi:hypothetical protein